MGAGMSTRGNMSSIGSSVRTCAQGGGRHAAPLEVCVLHAVGQLVRLTASWPGQARAVCFCVRLRTYRCMTWKRLAAGGLWGGGGLQRAGSPTLREGRTFAPCAPLCALTQQQLVLFLRAWSRTRKSGQAIYMYIYVSTTELSACSKLTVKHQTWHAVAPLPITTQPPRVAVWGLVTRAPDHVVVLFADVSGWLIAISYSHTTSAAPPHAAGVPSQCRCGAR